ncbi:bifunctional lysylphosphatidylglycerol flippase/synthetase MprF [Nevskia sp.]|uniref:bifunctional lysylphosphatidylglycerol flippase/synthetase MprF n=1 Tax=Nevskia sp. TaxID=1929292 RepID=UPI0025E674BB|nr:bifunctional lysylphosphatidylglycerol flippase/synthetase MprF [Nevskia sp.]
MSPRFAALFSDRRRVLVAGLTLVVLGLAVWALEKNLAVLNPGEILAHLKSLPRERIAEALLFCGLSYAVLTLYDWLALRGVDHPLPWRQVAPTSLIAFGIGHSVGFQAVSGGSIRFRDYTAAGVPGLKVAGVVALVSVAFALGVATLLGLSLLTSPDDAGRVLHLEPSGIRELGSGLLALVAAYVLLNAIRRRPLTWRGREFRLPGLPLTLGQIVAASTDLCFAAATLYVLLPDTVTLGYPAFVGVFVLAIYAGTISNVPGGLGVFETVLILLLPAAPPEGVLGAVLLYRVVYYLLPFVLALFFLGLRLLATQNERFRRYGSRLQDSVETLAPPVLATTVFLAGAVLLISGATPAIDSRLAGLSEMIPLGLLEFSHLAGSAIGVGLLILARGLYRRLDGAWWLTLVLLAVGAVVSMLKGLDYEEATLLSVILVVLLLSRERFYRRASLLEVRDSQRWLMATVAVVAVAVWVSMLSSRGTDYSREVWWRFAFDDQSPRLMRAGLLTVLLFAGYMLWRLLSPARREPDPPDAAALDRAASIIATFGGNTIANLALLGDKQLLFGPDGDAFIMYQRSGRSLIALGDPVGNPAKVEALTWAFRELADRSSCWPVFYQVSPDQLPLYLDLGLSLAKLGEEARVPLTTFSLVGSKRQSLRNEHRRAQRDGASFAVLAPAEVEAKLEELRRISDDWLTGKSVAEKGFSVGRFDPEYLSRFHCACVLRDGQIVAFANLWLGAGREEMSIDLMRYGPAAPKGVMDYLFIELMLWGNAQGYRWFNLGMAPLAGLENHPLAPFWHKLGRIVHRYGEPFYNFNGLRRYKEKFQPEWRPRYLASPGGLVLPRVLVDTAALIAGGIKEVIWKS